MDIRDIKEKKKDIEKQIGKILLDFYQDTGLLVSSLDVNNAKNYLRDDIVVTDVKVMAEVKF